MVKQFTSFLEEDFTRWQKTQEDQLKEQEKLRRLQEAEAKRTAEWVSSRPAYMKAADVILPGQQFRTPPSSQPASPAPTGVGDFRQLESKLLTTPATQPKQGFLQRAFAPAPPPSPETRARVGEEFARAWETRTPYQPTVKPLLPGKAGQFEARAMERGAHIVAPGPVGEVPSTGSTGLDIGADLLGTILGFTVPGGVGAGALKVGRAAAGAKTAQKALARLPDKLTVHAARGLEGAAAGTTFGAMESAAEDLSPKEAAKLVVMEAALWGVGDIAFRGLLEDVAPKVLPKALQFIKVQGQRFLKKNPKASFEDVQKAIAEDIGVKWENLNDVQKGKIGELANRMLEGPTLSQKKLTPGQEFTFRDLTHEEIVGRALPERPLALPPPREAFTLPEDPLQFKATIHGEKVSPQVEYPVDRQDRTLVEYFRSRNVTLREAAMRVQQKIDAIVNERVSELKRTGGQGIDQGGLIVDPNDPTGEVVGRYGRVSYNPTWYREFYARHGRKPNKGEYREIALEHLRDGYLDKVDGFEPPNEEFIGYEGLLNRIKYLRNKYPEEIIKVKPQEKETIKALMPGQDFELQGEPLRFKKPMAGPFEKGTATPPPEWEYPLSFKKTVEVPARKLQPEGPAKSVSQVIEAARPEAARPEAARPEAARPEGKIYEGLPESLAKGMIEAETKVRGAQAMAARPEAGPIAGEATGGILPRKVIIDRLLKSLDVPARVGRITHKRALGIFKIQPEVIRTKLAEDMPVLAHEVGHYLDKIIDISGSVTGNKAISDELIALGSTQPAHHFTEGIAEFFRRFLTGEDVSKIAPEFSKWFEVNVSKETKIWDALLQFRQDYIDYTSASSIARVKAAISTKEKGKRRMSVDAIMAAAVDDLRPIDSFVEAVTGGGKSRKALKITEDPFLQAWLFRGWQGKARNALNHSVMDDHGNVIGPSFKKILEPISKAKKIDDFRAYIIAKRAKELHGRGISPGIEIKDAVETIRQFETPEFVKAHEELKTFQDQILMRLVESGILSKEQVEIMRQLNREYVPFYRVFDENAAGIGFGKRGFADLQSPIKGIKGSSRTIVDPLESIVKNTYYLTRLAEQNNVGRTLVDFAQKVEGTGKFVERVPPKMYPVELTPEEINKILGEIGAQLPDGAALELTKIFRPQMMGSPKENIVAVFRNGKRELYQLDPDLYRAVNMLDRESTNTFIKMLSYPTSWLRAGAILTPEFMSRNIVRDSLEALVYSRYGFIPGFDTIKGLFHVLKRDHLYQQWLQSGGAMANFVSMDRNYLQKDLRHLLGRTVWDRMKHNANPMEFLRALSEFSEEATRVGEFAKGLKVEGMTKGGMQKAGLASRDVTLDFGRMGTVGKPANQLIAFFNAQVQGLDKMRRTFLKGDPKERAKAMLRATMGITMPSVVLWFLYHDDPRVQELPRWKRDLFWNIPTENYMISIPKPFENGLLFGTLAEDVLKWVKENDPVAIEDFTKSFRDSAMPGWIPTALLPLIEVYSGHSFFKDTPITPRGEEGLLKQEQYSPYTPEAAKVISRGLASLSDSEEAFLSPREIETMVRGYTGGLGMHAMEGVSAFLPKEIEPPASLLLESVPGVKGMVSSHYRGSASIDEFYNRLEELQKKDKTARKYYEAGKEIPPNLRYDRRELEKLKKVGTILTKLRKYKGEVIKDKKLTPEEKREIIDKIDMEMIDRARWGLGKELINH